MSNSIILTKNICKTYKNAKALNDFSISIEKGDIYGLIGPNGAGKSTFIKIVTGLTLPTSGEIELFGSHDFSSARKKIGSIIETPSFFKNLTAYENLIYYCKQFGCQEDIVDECLKKVKLFNVKNSKKFREYSLGMKQRLGIALALMNDPQLVILDEPTNGLDPVGISELRDIIRELNANGVTFIICSHILSELSQIATKFGIINEGKFIKEFTRAELFEMTSDRIIISTANIDKLKEHLHKRNFAFIDIEENTLEVDTKGLTVDDVAKEMINNKITISAIYNKKLSLEDIFFNILSGNGGTRND